MLNKTKLFGLLVIALVMSSCGLSSCTPTEVTVKEDNDGEWRIYDDKDNNQGIWIVKTGKEITWEVTGSDMIFSFPTDMSTYFEFNDSFFTEIDSIYTGPEGETRRIQRIDEGESLSLTVRKIDRDEGFDIRKPPINIMIDYDIYVIDAEKYVIGNSPPYIIVRRSY